MNNSLVAGVDIGGSHITAALVDLATGAVLSHTWQRNAVPATGSAEAILEAWSKVINDSCAAHAQRPARLGIAMPGPFDYEAGISLIQGQHKYEELYGLSVKKLLSVRTGFHTGSIRFTNDAACFLQGEVVAGAAKQHQQVVGLTLGTGLGSALYTGNVAEDAAWWNAPFNDSIAEDYLSSRWFVQRYQELTGQSVANVKELLTTEDNTMIKTIFSEFGQQLGAFLLHQLSNLQPELIVLGGNIAQAFDLFKPALLEMLKAGGKNIPVKQAILGEQAALIGAATAGLQGWVALPGRLTLGAISR